MASAKSNLRPLWRPPPNCLIFRRGGPGKIEQAFKQSGVYCPSCHEISRDLGELFQTRDDVDAINTATDSMADGIKNTASEEKLPSTEHPDRNSSPETIAAKASDEQNTGEVGDLNDTVSVKRPNRDSIIALIWEVSLELLVEAVHSKCQFCSLLLDRLFNDRFMTSMWSWGPAPNLAASSATVLKSLKKEDGPIQTSVKQVQSFIDTHPNATIDVAVFRHENSKTDPTDGRVVFAMTDTNLDQESFSSLVGFRDKLTVEFYAPKDEVAAQNVLSRPIRVDRGSNESLETVHDWLRDCQENHPQCPRILAQPPLPSRLIRIVNDETLQLDEDPQSGHYTILSYVWGGPQDCALTTSRLSQYKNGFSKSQLPKTLQDAIDLTRRLGQRYIWIDSLCIIQDSPDDKDAEIPRMAQYYQNSYVTLTSGQSSSHTGMFKVVSKAKEDKDSPEKDQDAEQIEADLNGTHLTTRITDGTQLPEDLLRMPYLTPESDVLTTIYFREEVPYFISKEPVMVRGWTMQEFALSPRCLIYGARLVWKCKTMERSDGGISGSWLFDLHASKIFDLQQGFTDVQDPEVQSDEDHELKGKKEEKAYDLWYSAIEEYSRRDLTLPEDKLRAIAGLATHFNQHINDQYIAGLWKRDLLRGLLWSTWPTIDTQRTPTWRAPTWSWASLENLITYSKLPKTLADPLAEIIACDVVPENPESKYGAIRSARLEIYGVYTKVEASILQKLAESEYKFPAPSNDKGFITPFHASLMFGSQKPRGASGSSEKWAAPENGGILLLLGEKKDKTSIERAMEESKSPKRPLDADEEELWHASALVLSERDDGTFERELDAARSLCHGLASYT